MDSSLPAVPSAPPVDPRLGTKLGGRYRVARRIGEGGMGVVYEGEHLGIKRRVAIKMLHPEYSKQYEIVERFRREAIAATAIRHPHIVEVLDMGEADDGAAYIVLEFLEGRDWADDLDKTGPQTLGKVARIMRQVCDGLQAAHDKGIVHRDLKPENVFLARHGSIAEHVKLVDFGISKMLEPDGPSESPKSAALTRTGAAMGTPYAMAPEQMQGAKDIDHRADLWSLGVMMYRALTNAYPFEGDTFPMLAVAVLTGDPLPLSTYRDDLPPQIQEMVTRLLDKRKDHRFASARELRAALQPFEADDLRPSLVARSPTIPLGSATPKREPEPPKAPEAELEPRVSVPSATPAPPAATQPIPPPAGVRPPGPMANETTYTLPTTTGPSMVTVALLTVALVGLGAGGALYLSNREVAPAAIATPPVEPAVVPPVVVPTEPTTAPAETTTVRVQITATPAAAELFLDGSPLSNPFDGDLPSSTEPHTLEVRAAGYESHTRTISLAFAQRITVELEREGGRAGRTARGSSTIPIDPPEGAVVTPVATSVATPADPPREDPPREDPPREEPHETPAETPREGRPFRDPFGR